MRYTLGIPYRSYFRSLMKALVIIDSETSYLIDKLTMIKLLHRTDISKRELVEKIENRNERWWFYKEIQTICNRLNIEPEEVCY